MAERGDADLPEVLVTHVREDLDVDVLPVEYLPQRLQVKTGEEGAHRHVEARLGRDHLSLGEVRRAVARVRQGETRADPGGGLGEGQGGRPSGGSGGGGVSYGREVSYCSTRTGRSAGVELLLGPKVLCALFLKFPLPPLSTLWWKFQNKAGSEPLTQ